MEAVQNLLKAQKFTEQDASIDPRIKDFLKDLTDYRPTIPMQVVTDLLKKVGFHSEDQNCYKLIALLADQFTFQQFQNISDLRERKHPQTQMSGSQNKTLHLNEILQEMDAQGNKVYQKSFYPNSQLIDRYIQKQAQLQSQQHLKQKE